MRKRRYPDWTVIYPGVILRSNNLLMNPASTIRDSRRRRKADASLKAGLRPARARSRKFVNILVED